MVPPTIKAAFTKQSAAGVSLESVVLGKRVPETKLSEGRREGGQLEVWRSP